jgi:tetratricopeptide (TPR) repeat protein
LQIDFKELSRRLKEPRISRDLAPYGMNDPFEILDNFLCDAKHARQWVDTLPVQTDDQPFVSYITKYSQGRRMDAASLIPVRSSVIPLLYNMGNDEQKIRQWWNTAFEANGFLMAGQLDNAAKTRPAGKKIALSQKRFAGSESYYLRLAKLYHSNPQHLFWAASMLANNGFPKKAVTVFRRALELWPGNSTVQINLALALLDSGKPQEAHNVIVDVLKNEPDNPLANYNYGVVLLNLDNPGEAAGYLAKALYLDPELPGAKLSLADSYRRMGQFDKARSLMQSLTAQSPWNDDAWNLLGLTEGDRGNRDQAIRDISKALSLNPYKADFHYNMGIILEKENRFKEAAGAYLAALSIDERDAEARNNLGLLYGQAGLYDKAIEQHLKALEIEPAYPEAAFNLGLAYRAYGNPVAAAEAFTIALKLDPDLVQAAAQLKELGVKDAIIEIESHNK